MFDVNELAAIHEKYFSVAQDKINLIESEMEKLQAQMNLKQKQLDYAKGNLAKIEEKYKNLEMTFG